MIASVKGRINFTGPGYVVVEAGGIGYRVFVPVSALEFMIPGHEVLLYTYLNVREDAMLLYGFLSLLEKEVFQKLISVSGIGPKIGLSILSVLSIEQIAEGINTQNFSFFSAVPGVGPKTAQRIVLELAGKLPDQGMEKPVGKTEKELSGRSAANETVEALVALGYPLQTANQTVAKVQRENPEAGTAELVRKALRELVKIK